MTSISDKGLLSICSGSPTGTSRKFIMAVARINDSLSVLQNDLLNYHDGKTVSYGQNCFSLCENVALGWLPGLINKLSNASFFC